MSAAVATGSGPMRGLMLVLAALGGWTAARLPAAIAQHQALSRQLAAAAPEGAPSGATQELATAAPQPVAAPAPVYVFPPEAASTRSPIIIREIIYREAPYRDGAGPMPERSPQPGDLAEYRLPEAVAQTQAGRTAAPPPALPPAPLLAGDFAAAAYQRLQAGERREALRLFDAALAASAEIPDPRAAQWRRDAQMLRRRWSGQAFALIRETGLDPATGIATGPLLGTSQSGFAVAYTPSPLARRPLAVTARVNAATDADGRTDNRTAQAAFGVRWQATPAVALSGERLVSLGEFARDDWLVRLSAGTSRSFRPRGLAVNADAYGEVSLLGNGDVVSAGQLRGLTPVLSKPVSLAAGLGAWGSVQKAGPETIGRLDLGPSAVVRLGQGRFGFEIAADYRQRLAGNAEPGSGPTVTLSTNF
jgi:hypothetical protein